MERGARGPRERGGGVLIANGTPADPFPSDQKNHGTAVLGQLVGTDNGFGVTGLAPESAIAMVNAAQQTAFGISLAIADAMSVAQQNLDPGDVILLEQQTVGRSGTGTEANPYVPIEYLPEAYDAIRLATLDGIIVVEAAGNGGVNLDHSQYGTRFPDAKPDSGAIIVGAGSGDATCSATPNARLAFSTYGTRVNLQGWGRCVATTGYGSLFDGGVNARYTQSFSGTSSASPIVAAAAALYSSVFQSETGRAPTPQHVRSRLMATGAPQAGTGGNIGPLPNVLTALTGYDATPPTVSLAGPSGPTNDATPTFTFTASEPGSTFECRTPRRGVLLAVQLAADVRAARRRAERPRGPRDRRRLQHRSRRDARVHRRHRGPDGVDPRRAGRPDRHDALVHLLRERAGRLVRLPRGRRGVRAVRVAVHGGGARGWARTSSRSAPRMPLRTRGLRRRGRSRSSRRPRSSHRRRRLRLRLRHHRPPPAPAPAIVGSATPTDLAPQLSAGMRVTVRVPGDGWVRLPRPRITCPSLPPACTVTVTARRRLSGKPQVASAKLTIAAGASSTVRFRLYKSARTRAQAPRPLRHRRQDRGAARRRVDDPDAAGHVQPLNARGGEERSGPEGPPV